MQQFMFYRSAQEERPRNYVLDKHPSLRFQSMPTSMGALDPNQKATPAFPYQKIFDLNGQFTGQYPLHPYHQLPRTGQLNAHHHQSIPLNTVSPFFKVQGAQNGPNIAVISPFGGGIAVSAIDGHVVGPFAPRIMPPQHTHMTSQLTIFYGGCVNVFDDVASDKAQAIMSLASKASNSVTPNKRNPRTAPAPVPTKLLAVPDGRGISQEQTLFPAPIFAVSPGSSLSSPVSATSNTVSSPGSGSNTNNDTPPPVHTIQQENHKTSTAMPRAIPQARKASLARFLEKRKERMINMPYPCSKVNLETAIGLESCNMSSTSSSANINLSSFQQDSWFAAQQKRSTQSSMEFLSTKLKI